MFPTCHLVCSTWQKWAVLLWSPREPESYCGSLFGAVCRNTGCNALQIPDGRFQTGQDPQEGCAVISPASTPGGIQELVPRRSGPAGRTNKALTCFSARQLHVVQQETLCTTWPGHSQNKRALRDWVNSWVLMSICVIFVSLKIKCSQEELNIICACSNICYKVNSKTLEKINAVTSILLPVKQ